MLVTAIAGPILTTNFARKLSVMVPDNSAKEYHLRDNNSEALNSASGELKTKSTARFRVVVPVANPATVRNSIEMGALLARHEQGVICLSIAKAHGAFWGRRFLLKSRLTFDSFTHCGRIDSKRH